MGKPFPAAKVWLFVLLGFVVPGLSQITNLGSQPPAVPSTCSISTEEIRVLPNDYQRSVLQPFVSTVAGENFNESAADLAACRYLSFDPAFDLLIGSNRTLYQIGLDRPYNFAHEGGIYLPGVHLLWLLRVGSVAAVNSPASRQDCHICQSYRADSLLSSLASGGKHGLPCLVAK